MRGPAIDPTGYDAGKKIKGRKRHILVDTQGLLMHAIVHAADVQDRDGGALLMASLFGGFPFLIKLYADGGYQGPEFQSAVNRILARVNVEIVKRSDQATGFVALPKRWIVERTFAWLGRCRRLAKDWECRNHKALAFLRLASIRLMLRKLCNPAGCSRTELSAARWWDGGSEDCPKPVNRGQFCCSAGILIPAALIVGGWPVPSGSEGNFAALLLLVGTLAAGAAGRVVYQMALTATENDNGFVTMFSCSFLVCRHSFPLLCPHGFLISTSQPTSMFFVGLALVAAPLFVFSMKSRKIE